MVHGRYPNPYIVNEKHKIWIEIRWILYWIFTEFYLNKKIETEKDIKIASEEFLKKGIKNIVITLGEKGCYFANDKENFFMNAFKLKEPVVDTTGAGDAFNGALAVGLSKNLDIKEVLTFANKVGAISTTKQGAAASMPSMEDLKNY